MGFHQIKHHAKAGWTHHVSQRVGQTNLHAVAIALAKSDTRFARFLCEQARASDGVNETFLLWYRGGVCIIDRVMIDLPHWISPLVQRVQVTQRNFTKIGELPSLVAQSPTS
ncbi:hypothetical protein QFZ94_008468 [Paraburkholderia sp. JPY465]|uniref:hypothetical protein n=1 Tax=Paraburkholderia sp. JPY465 TaxID=3042285 RepID=UPI003D1C98F0